jgi:hypothetical protein
LLTEFSIAPHEPCDCAKANAMARLALAAYDEADARELLGHLLVRRDDLVERVGDFSGKAGVIARQAHREIADAHRLHRI